MAARKIVQAGRKTKRRNTGPTLMLGTIKAVHDYDGNMVSDVTVRGADLLGLDMTVDCVNAQPGDRCVIQEQAHHAMVTGILAKPGAWVPVTQTTPVTLINSSYGTVKGIKCGNVVELKIEWKSAATGSWDTGSFGTLPSGWRPCQQVIGTWSGRDGESQRQIRIETSGAVSYANMGGGQYGGGFGCTITYIAA